MLKSNRLVLGAVLTLGLGAPALAWGQAVPRGSAPSEGSSSSGSSGGGSSSSSSGGGGSSDSGSSPTYSPPPPPPQRTPPPPRTAPPDGERTGGAVRRGTSPASSPSTAGSTGDRSGVSSGDAGRSNSGDADPRSRSRNGRPVTGLAIERDNTLGGGSAYSGDFSRSYPFSWYYGYPLYSPYSSYNRYGYNRYGVWYDPYDPFGYYDPIYSDPMGYGGYGGYGGSGGDSYSSSSSGSSGPAPRDEATGTIRVRVKPAFGKVYLDGTLIGVVDEFDGLSSHLAATVGRHELEVRADGYESLKVVVNVDEDKTTTARGWMRKK